MSGCMPSGSALRGAAAEVVRALTEAATRTGCGSYARDRGPWFTTGHPGRHAPFLQPVAPRSASGYNNPASQRENSRFGRGEQAYHTPICRDIGTLRG